MIGRKFQKYDNFLFDLDGTVWNWIKTYPGAIRLFQELRKENKKVYFFTNNMILTRAAFAKKLTDMGIPARESHVINPSLVAADVLKDKKVYVIGEGIVTDLRKAKIKIVSSNPDAVLVSTDRHLTYDKMAKAAEFIMDGAEFYTNASGGKWVYGHKITVGAGAIAAAIALVCGKEPVLIGKPSDFMFNKIKSYKFDPKKTLMVGDEHKSDIPIGNRLGFDTALVLTGVSSKKDYESARGKESPKYLLNSIAEIIE